MEAAVNSILLEMQPFLKSNQLKRLRDASPAPSKALPLTLLAVGTIALLYYSYRFFTISAQNKLREALLIIKMESKPDETSNTAAQS